MIVFFPPSWFQNRCLWLTQYTNIQRKKSEKMLAGHSKTTPRKKRMELLLKNVNSADRTPIWIFVYTFHICSRILFGYKNDAIDSNVDAKERHYFKHQSGTDRQTLLAPTCMWKLKTSERTRGCEGCGWNGIKKRVVANDAEVELDRKITSHVLQHRRINLAKSKYFKIASREDCKWSHTQQW